MSGSEENDNGNTLVELVHAGIQLGFVPYVCCLLGKQHHIGHGHIPVVQIREGTDADLTQWLRYKVEKQPAIVLLDRNRISHGSSTRENEFHFIVVINVTEDIVEYLEPDPVQCADYPVQGKYKVMNFESFMSAWRFVGHLALILKQPAMQTVLS